MNIEKVIETINELMQKKKLKNISEVAALTGVSDATLSKLIRYRIKRPSDQTLEAIARHAGCTVAHFSDAIAPTASNLTSDQKTLLDMYRQLSALNDEGLERAMRYFRYELNEAKASGGGRDDILETDSFGTDLEHELGDTRTGKAGPGGNVAKFSAQDRGKPRVRPRRKY